MSEEQASAPEVSQEVSPTPVTVVETEKPSIEGTMGEVFDKLNPAREATGQFKAKPEIKSESADTGDPAKEINQEPAAKVEETEKAPSIPRPQSWSADVDAKWAALPPDVQELIAKRESEAHQKITALGETAKSAETYRAVIEPLEQVAKRSGISAAEGLHRLLAADAYLARDPVGAIQWLANNYGVNLSNLAQPGQQDSTPENAQIRSLSQELMLMKRQLAETSQNINARSQQEIADKQASLVELVTNFVKGKESYWSDIENEVLVQATAIRQSEPNLDPKLILEKAHDRALKINDEVSKRLNAEKEKEKTAKKAAEDKKKADEAKKQASLNVKSSTGSSPKGGKLNLESDMAEVYDRLNAA